MHTSERTDPTPTAAPRPGMTGLRSSLSGASLVVASVAIPTPAGATEALELVPDPATLTMLLVGFALLVYPVNALIFRPLLRVLDDRDEKIAGARRRAEQLGHNADESLAHYRESVRQVRESSERERRLQLDAARSEQAAMAAKARADVDRQADQTRLAISDELAEARGNLRVVAEELAREAAARILGRSLS